MQNIQFGAARASRLADQVATPIGGIRALVPGQPRVNYRVIQACAGRAAEW